MSGALEPVEDVSAAGVVHLVEGVRVRLLDGDGVAVETEDRQSYRRSYRQSYRQFSGDEDFISTKFTDKSSFRCHGAR